MLNSSLKKSYPSDYTKLAGLALLMLLALFPKPSEAKVFEFNKQTFKVDAVVKETVSPVLIRPADVGAVSRNALLGSSEVQQNSLFHDATLSQINDIKKQITQSPQSAKLIVANNKAVEFEPDRQGQTLDVYKLYLSLINTQPESPLLPVVVSDPAIKLSQTNDLGIKELVAVGESDFSGSPNNRLVNIKVGAAKFNGLIIPATSEFSFNTYLGDVDEANGFLPELVIKRNGLVPEVGGGLCQVSSTAFRAAMKAGMPIVERRNHSFPVRYYAPQGTDATIYPGSSDLRFTNNLASSLLIRTRVVGAKLFFEFYGTKDDRVVTFDGPYQYDKKPDGSMKATWSRKVVLAGQESEQTFKSIYLSPDLFPKIAVAQSTIPNPSASPATN